MNLFILQESFTIDLGEGPVTWDVSAIQAMANQGMFGLPERMPLSMFLPFDWSTGYLSRDRVEKIKLDRERLDDPILTIEAPPPDDDKLVCCCDGQHRIVARTEMGMVDVFAFVVPWDSERKFRMTQAQLDDQRRQGVVLR